MLWNGLLSLLYYELFQLEFLNSKLPFEVFTLCAQQRLIHSNTTVSTPPTQNKQVVVPFGMKINTGNEIGLDFQAPLMASQIPFCYTNDHYSK